MSVANDGVLRDEGLAELDNEAEQLKASVEEALGSLPAAVREVSSRPAVDPSIQKRLRDLRDRVMSMKPAIDRAEIDLDQANTLLSAIIDVDRAVESDAPDLDRFETILLGIERIRQVVRDALDEYSGGAEADTATLLRGLEETLPGVTQSDIARLLGVDPRTVRRWEGAEGAPAADRLRLVARLVAILKHAWTPAGVLAWFDRPRAALGDRRPIELLEDPASERELVSEARASRNQYAT